MLLFIGYYPGAKNDRDAPMLKGGLVRITSQDLAYPTLHKT